MRTIKFTQYLRPDGRRITVDYEPQEDVPDEVFDMADVLVSNGAKLECEELRTGHASFTCERGDDLLAHVVCKNGPDAVKAVQDLIRKAHTELHALSRD